MSSAGLDEFSHTAFADKFPRPAQAPSLGKQSVRDGGAVRLVAAVFEGVIGLTNLLHAAISV